MKNYCGGKELTGTALFVYAMALEINNGLLDKEKYLPVVLKGWGATVEDNLHDNRFLGFVQSTDKDQQVAKTHRSTYLCIPVKSIQRTSTAIKGLKIQY